MSTTDIENRRAGPISQESESDFFLHLQHPLAGGSGEARRVVVGRRLNVRRFRKVLSIISHFSEPLDQAAIIEMPPSQCLLNTAIDYASFQEGKCSKTNHNNSKCHTNHSDCPA